MIRWLIKAVLPVTIFRKALNSWNLPSVKLLNLRAMSLQSAYYTYCYIWTTEIAIWVHFSKENISSSACNRDAILYFFQNIWPSCERIWQPFFTLKKLATFFYYCQRKSNEKNTFCFSHPWHFTCQKSNFFDWLMSDRVHNSKEFFGFSLLSIILAAQKLHHLTHQYRSNNFFRQ